MLSYKNKTSKQSQVNALSSGSLRTAVSALLATSLLLGTLCYAPNTALRRRLPVEEDGAENWTKAKFAELVEDIIKKPNDTGVRELIDKAIESFDVEENLESFSEAFGSVTRQARMRDPLFTEENEIIRLMKEFLTHCEKRANYDLVAHIHNLMTTNVFVEIDGKPAKSLAAILNHSIFDEPKYWKSYVKISLMTQKMSFEGMDKNMFFHNLVAKVCSSDAFIEDLSNTDEKREMIAREVYYHLSEIQEPRPDWFKFREIGNEFLQLDEHILKCFDSVSQWSNAFNKIDLPEPIDEWYFKGSGEVEEVMKNPLAYFGVRSDASEKRCRLCRGMFSNNISILRKNELRELGILKQVGKKAKFQLCEACKHQMLEMS